MKENLNNTKFVTPVMKQFWEAKSSYPDSIMLFRMGDFYETFDEDAKIASNILGIALTKRSNGAAASVPLAGFPYHSLDQYLYKLLNIVKIYFSKNETLDIKEFKKITNTSRKYAVPLLEYFDKLGLTYRVGNERKYKK